MADERGRRRQRVVGIGLGVAMAVVGRPVRAAAPEREVPVQRPKKLAPAADRRDAAPGSEEDASSPVPAVEPVQPPEGGEHDAGGPGRAPPALPDDASSPGAAPPDTGPSSASARPPVAAPSPSPPPPTTPPPAAVPGTDDELPPGLEGRAYADRDRRPGPTRRGGGLLVAGAVMGGAFVLARDLVFAFDLAGMRRAARRPPSDHLGDIDIYWITPYFVAPLQLLSAVPTGLLAAGAYRRGRWNAWFGADEGVPDVGRLRRRAAFGWTVVGLGYALYLTDMLLVYVPPERLWDTDFALYLTHIGISLGGTAAIATGLAIGPYAAGRLRGRAERRRISWTVTPAPVRAGGGVQLAGRF